MKSILGAVATIALMGVAQADVLENVIVMPDGTQLHFQISAGAMYVIKPEPAAGKGFDGMVQIFDGMLPMRNGPGPFFIDMTNAPVTPEPEHAVIEIDGEHHCLLMYKGVCIIMGNRLEVR